MNNNIIKTNPNVTQSHNLEPLNNERIILNISSDTINSVIAGNTVAKEKSDASGNTMKFSYSLKNTQTAPTIQVPLEIGKKTYQIYVALLDGSTATQTKWNSNTVVVKKPMSPSLFISVVIQLSFKDLQALSEGYWMENINQQLDSPQLINQQLDSPQLDLDEDARSLLDRASKSRRNIQCTALHYACLNRNRKIVKWLLDHGANPNIKNKKGSTPLHEVICGKSPNTDIVKLLIEDKRIDLNIKDAEGYTSLFQTIMCDRVEITKLLIKAGVNLNQTDPQGNTPLHWAIKMYNKQIPRFFDNRETPYMYSYWYSISPERDMFHLLVSHKSVKLNISNKDGNTPLMTLLYLNYKSNKLDEKLHILLYAAYESHKAEIIDAITKQEFDKLSATEQKTYNTSVRTSLQNIMQKWDDIDPNYWEYQNHLNRVCFYFGLPLVKSQTDANGKKTETALEKAKKAWMEQAQEFFRGAKLTQQN